MNRVIDCRVVAFAEESSGVGHHMDLHVRAMDGSEEFGHGTHARVVIDLAKFSERLAAKCCKDSH